MSNVYDYYFENYLMLHNLYGKGRPQLDREIFEALDRELLDLVARLPDQVDSAGEAQLARDTFNRIRDLEYLLLDDISEALYVAPKASPDARDTATTTTRELPKLEFRWSDDSGALSA